MTPNLALHRSLVDVAHLLRRTASLFEAISRDRRVSFTVVAPDALAAVVDAEKLERVLLNLLSNAAKFVPDGGRVRVELHASDDRLVLTVEDNGPGVPPALRETIVERFHPGDHSTTRRLGGMGLGLSIAKEFVELQGGRMTVDDAAGGGAVFRVELPRPRAAERELPTATAPAAGRGLVLVVEDNPDMNRFVSDTLAADYAVATAFDGREGLEKALALRPDVILSDIVMPVMPGTEFVRTVRTHHELDGTPIILLSAKPDEDLRAQLLRSGAQDYLTKPFAAEELRARVTNLMALKRARDVLQRELATQAEDVVALASELARRQRELAAANRAKDEFLATLSHEMRTPVTGVLGWIWLLRRRELDPARAAHAFETMEQGMRSLLRIIDDMLELHGGTVEAESAGPHQGATFTVTLPALGSPIVAAVPAAEPPGAGVPAGLAGVRVLVVEDEAETREVLTVTLADSGADVRATASAAEALDVLATWQPDVLVSDIAMPGEDGYALLGRVRGLASDAGGTVPALALTAYARDEDRTRALAAGFQDYLAKPFEPPVLVAAVARLAAGRRGVTDPNLQHRTGADWAGATAWAAPGTVLVVEDDPGTCEYDCAVLQQHGHHVLSARTAEEALRVWAAHRNEIDLVLTDLVMLPGSSGVKVWHTVHAQRREVPVILVTGYPRVAEMFDPQRDGVVECLAKPVEPEDLAAAVGRALRRAPGH